MLGAAVAVAVVVESRPQEIQFQWTKVPGEREVAQSCSLTWELTKVVLVCRQ